MSTGGRTGRTGRRGRHVPATTAILLAAAMLPACGNSPPEPATRPAPSPQSPPPPQMPPLPPERADVYEHYKLQFLPDGYPGKVMDHGVMPHPIYGAYVISDYLRLYAETGERQYLDGARKVADATIRRMERFHDGLVFWYLPESAVASRPGKFYSGLTQAKYTQVLARLWQVTGEQRYLDAAQSIFRSLLIPRQDGGVLSTLPVGVLIEEHPHDPPTFILNGWIAAMRCVHEYAEAADSDEARKLFQRNVDGLASILHLYDVPDLANTRYQLTGFVYLRLEPGDPFDGRIRDARIVIPTQGTYPIDPQKRSDRWGNSFVAGGRPEDGALVVTEPIVQANVLLCMICHPEPNRVEMTIESRRPATCRVLIAAGDYDPLLSGMPTQRWEPLATVQLAPGPNPISVPIPWQKAWLVAWPTNFKIEIGGRRYNGYHFTHIRVLADLYAVTGREVFDRFSRKWAGYVDKWPQMPVYRDAGVQLQPYQPSATQPAPSPAAPSQPATTSP